MIFVTVSTGHYDLLIESCNRLTHKYSFYGQIGDSLVEPNFPYYRMAPPSKLIEDMVRADIVIAHGGTGILTDLYRLKKPCIVVPKQKRFGENDLQIDLACRWARLKMGVLCLDPRDLELALEEYKRTQFEFPRFPSLGSNLRAKIDELSTCEVEKSIIALS